VLSIEDRLDILDLYARYAQAVDEGRYADWCACFTDDGYLAVPVNNIHVQGPEQLDKFARGYWKRSGCLERHLFSNIVIAADGEDAQGSCYLTMLIGGSKEQTPRFTTTGVYRDRLARVADGWRVRGRDLDVDVRASE
jgi:hypothetical protein